MLRTFGKILRTTVPVLCLVLLFGFPGKSLAGDRFDFGDFEPEIYGVLSPNLLDQTGLQTGVGGGAGFLYIPYFFDTTRLGVRGHFSYLLYPTVGPGQSTFTLMPVTGGLQFGITHFEDDKHNFLYVFSDGGFTLGGTAGSDPLVDVGVGMQWDLMFIEIPFTMIFNGYPHTGGAGSTNLQDVMIMMGFDL